MQVKLASFQVHRSSIDYQRKNFCLSYHMTKDSIIWKKKLLLNENISFCRWFLRFGRRVRYAAIYRASLVTIENFLFVMQKLSRFLEFQILLKTDWSSRVGHLEISVSSIFPIF